MLTISGIFSGLPALSRWPYGVPAVLPPAARFQNSRAFLHSKRFPQAHIDEAKTHNRSLCEFPKPQTSTSLQASQTTREISEEYGEQHHFQHGKGLTCECRVREGTVREHKAEGSK